MSKITTQTIKKHEYDNAVRKLTALLDDYRFGIIKAVGSKFNIFDALGVRRQELRHSDFLSYLLCPTQPHGLGDRFLRDFLIRTDLYVEGESSKYLNPIALRTSDLGSVKVHRERHRMDIVIENSTDWVVIIENKVGSSERENQTIDYRRIAKRVYRDRELGFILLSPDGDAPIDEVWTSLSYNVIRDLALEWSQKDAIPTRTALALADYSDYLEAHVLTSSNISDLCKQIYRQHKDALELIEKYAESPRDILKRSVNQVVEELAAREVVIKDSKLNGIPRLIDPKIIQILPRMPEGIKWTDSGIGILIEWTFTPNDFQLNLVLGPFESEIKSRIIRGLEQLKGEGYKDSKSKQYNHVYRQHIISLDEISDWEKLEDTLVFRDKLREKVIAAVDKHTRALGSVLRNM